MASRLERGNLAGWPLWYVKASRFNCGNLAGWRRWLLRRWFTGCTLHLPEYFIFHVSFGSLIVGCELPAHSTPRRWESQAAAPGFDYSRFDLQNQPSAPKPGPFSKRSPAPSQRTPLPRLKRVQQTGVARLACTAKTENPAPRRRSGNQRLSVQQIATPEVRNGA